MFEALLAPFFFVVLVLVGVVIVTVQVLRRRRRGHAADGEAPQTRTDQRDRDTIDRRRTG